jgi:glucose/arabinose dehydrogenase
MAPAALDSAMSPRRAPANRANAAPPPADPFAGADFSPKAPVVAGSPSDEQARFILPPGYHMTPILTEPAIQQPASIAFDGDGRMFVLELRSYMLDADAKNQLAPVSRISRWTDSKHDGVYDTHTVFVDSLVFPRFVTPYGANAILTMESNSNDVYKYTDTNSDGRADKREIFTGNFGRLANVEHLQSSLFWAMDNWLYSTVNAFRIRQTANGVIREPTGFNGAQWGATQDDDGKQWFQGGASGIPSYFQLPIAYGNFTVPDQYEPGFDEIWGAPMGTADMQGGMPFVRMPDGSLSRATAGSGSNVYRGGSLPHDLIGDYFYGEVVGRVVRRVHPVDTEGLTQLHNVYQKDKAEFIRTTDPLFRPVEIKSAPDGSMYIVDMYHGEPMDAEGLVPAREDRAVPAREGSRPRARLAPDPRRRCARDTATAHALGAACTARATPREPERLVARHGATAARAQAGQVGGSRAQADGAARHDTRRALSRPLDPRRAQCTRPSVRCIAARRCTAAHAHPGAACE